MNNTTNETFEIYLKETETPFSGWDFSYFHLTQRMVESPLGWNYSNKIIPRLIQSSTLLDMGTGGGELLSALKPLPEHSFATECYEPNIPIARKRLQPLHVEVIGLENYERLPFEDNYFDLIINRHESYTTDELWRTLKNGGVFITQQVGSKNNIQINRDFNVAYPYENSNGDLEHASTELKEAGFDIIEMKEEFPISRFYDVGALIYYLKAIPWQIKDFSTDAYYHTLKMIHDMTVEKGYYDVNAHRFYMIARKL